MIPLSLCFIFFFVNDMNIIREKIWLSESKRSPIWRTAKMKKERCGASLSAKKKLHSVYSQCCKSQRSELSRHTCLQSRQLDSGCPAIASLSKQEFVTWELGKCNYFSTLRNVSCISRYLVAVPVQLQTFIPYVVLMLTFLKKRKQLFS